MGDVMVTGRMSQAKKEAGNRVLEKLGSNASQFINEMYDYLISYGKSPVAQTELELGDVDKERLSAALEHVRGLAQHCEGRFQDMSDDQIKRERLASRGLMEA